MSVLNKKDWLGGCLLPNLCFSTQVTLIFVESTAKFGAGDDVSGVGGKDVVGEVVPTMFRNAYPVPKEFRAVGREARVGVFEINRFVEGVLEEGANVGHLTGTDFMGCFAIEGGGG
jgi:hypothetical protein